MKKTIVSAIIVFLGVSMTAQRLLPGMRGIQIYGGILEKDGYHASLGYSTYLRGQNHAVFETDFLLKNYTYDENLKIPLMQFSVDGSFHKKFYADPSRCFFLFGGVGFALGYETINLGRKVLPDGATILNKDSWLYGAIFSLSMEYYYNDNYVVLWGIKERILGGSTVGTFHTQFYLGLKFMIND